MSRIPLTPLRRNRDFLLPQWGQLFSTAGTSATQIAYPLLVLALTHSPAKAGIVGIRRGNLLRLLQHRRGRRASVGRRCGAAPGRGCSRAGAVLDSHARRARGGGRALRPLVFQEIFLVFAVVARRHGLSSGGIGLCFALFGASALLGSVAAPLVNRLLSMRRIVVLNMWLNSTIAAYVFVPSNYVLLASSVLVSFFIPAGNAAIIGYRTAVTPDRLIGRVSSVARGIALAAQPLGPLVAGLLLAATTPRWTVFVFAGVMVLLALWATLSPSIRRAPSLRDLAPA